MKENKLPEANFVTKIFFFAKAKRKFDKKNVVLTETNLILTRSLSFVKFLTEIFRFGKNSTMKSKTSVLPIQLRTWK